MYVIIYRPVNQGETWETFGPFYSKTEAGDAAKLQYTTKGPRHHRPWVVVPVTPAGKLEYA